MPTGTDISLETEMKEGYLEMAEEHLAWAKLVFPLFIEILEENDWD